MYCNNDRHLLGGERVGIGVVASAIVVVGTGKTSAIVVVGTGKTSAIVATELTRTLYYNYCGVSQVSTPIKAQSEIEIMNFINFLL